MGVSFYKCFLCGYIGGEGAFEGDTGEHISKQYCNDCVEEDFEVAPVHYWIKEDDGTIVSVPVEFFNDTSEYIWSYSFDSADIPTFEEERPPHRFRPIVTHRPKATFKKRALERIDKKEESLKRFRRVIEEEY